MSKSLRLAKVSAKGGFNLLWGLIISSIISALGVVLVGDLLTEAEFGLVSFAFVGPNIIAYVTDLGISSAIIKYATQHRTEQNTRKLKNVIMTGTIFEVILGILFTIFSIALSGFMANLLERPTIVFLIQVASFSILAGTLLKAAQSVFISHDNMKLHSITLVFHSVFKTTLMVLLVYLGLGAYGATFGNVLSYISAGLVGIAVMYVAIIKKMPQEKDDSLQLFSTLKTLLTFGLPLSIASMLVGGLSEFYKFLVARYIPNAIMGNYEMAVSFAMLVSLFASSIATMLFPTFSKVKGHEEQKTLSNVFRYSVKYTSLLIVPATFAVIVLSRPGVQTLFPGRYEETPLFLALYATTFLYSAIGNLSVGALINSQGKTQFNLKITVLTFTLGIIMALLLIPPFGVLGLLAVHIFVGMPGILISLWWINKHYNATIDWNASIKIMVASAFSGLLTYIVTAQLNLATWIILLIGTAVFLSSYLIVAPLIGAINYADTQNLKALVKTLGPLYAVIHPFIVILEKITSRKQKE